MPLDDTSRPPSKAAFRKQAKAAAAKRLSDAQKARKEADKEWDNALVGAVKAGVIPDCTANPESAGTNRVVYKDAVLQITLSVAASISGIYLPGFLAGLAKAKVDPKLITRLSIKHATETRPAHKFTASQV